jgi:hypothetical protein
MFQDLYAVARHTPFTIIVTPQGERLSLIIQPRPSGDAEDRKGLAAPIKAVGTPAELDAELPAKLREYAERVNEVRATIDLPLDAVDAEKAKQSKKTERAQKRADAKKKAEADAEAKRKARADAKAKRKADEEAKRKAAADKRAKTLADKKKAKESAGAGIKLPGATGAQPAAAGREIAWPFPTGTRVPIAAPAAAKEPKHLDGLPGKDDCLLDYRNLKRVHGAALTRRLFIKKSDTGRRYEKLWPNWGKFIKEAEAQLELPIGAETTRAADSAAEATAKAVHPATAPGESPGARSTESGPAAQSTPQPGSAGEGAVPAGADAGRNEGSTPSGSVTAADDLADDSPPTKGKGKGTSTDVYDEAGNYLSSITTKPELGKHIGLVSHNDFLRIVAIDTRPSGGLDVTVVPDPDYTRQQAGIVAAKVQEQARALARPAPEKKYVLVDSADGAVIASSKWPYTIGERLDLQVIDGERRYLVDGKEGELTATAHEVLKHRKLLLDEAGNRLADTDEIYGIADPVAELAGQDWRVVRVEENAYYAKAAKPRLKGPVAATVTQE